MIYDVRIFYNTGFNPSNIPFSADIITNNFTATSKTFDAVFELQNKGLEQVKIKATWDDVDGADYLMLAKPGVNVWYFITNITMSNENTAILSLAMDALTTIGLDKITDTNIIDGITTRHHDDKYKELYHNNLEEPWSVASPLKIIGYMIIGPDVSGDEGFVHIVGSTVNLHGNWYEAEKWKDVATGVESDVVYTPKLPKFTSGNAISFVGIQTPSTRYIKQVPVSTLYQFNVDIDINTIQPLLEIGLLDCLNFSYSVPGGYISEITKSGDEGSKYITSLVGDFHTYQVSTLPYEYYDDIINKKVFSHYCYYSLISISTGDEIQFEPYDIYEPETLHPAFVTYADPSSEGRPYARPKVYEGDDDLLFMASVQGANWLETPLRFTGSNNSYFTNARKAVSDVVYRDTQLMNYGKGAVGGMLGVGSNYNPTAYENYMEPLYNMHIPHYALKGSMINNVKMVSTGLQASVAATRNPVSNMISTAESIYGNEMNKAIADLDYIQSKVNAPTLLFANQPTLQNYFGNRFAVILVGQNHESAKIDDQMFNMYGEAIQPRKTVIRDFNSRMYFNYVQTGNIKLRVNQSRYITEVAELQLNSGVRIWHTVPDPKYYSMDNPVKGVAT